MLTAMRTLCLLIFLALPSALIAGQAPPPAPAFDVASVKPCRRIVGLDYNNRLTYSPNGLTARNITLKRLVAEAYRLQLSQVSGPSWIDQNEYDIDARTTGAATGEQIVLMLRSLLAERFDLKQHSEVREMRVHDLMVGKSGVKIHPMNDGETAAAYAGSHFHADMRSFADFLAVMFTMPAASSLSEPVIASDPQIPVLDKTVLTGIFDFSVDMRPELGTDGFTTWQRVLQDQLGLSIESRKENVGLLVVDEAAKVPTVN
jgi:uncharacterized protein (TIGR03435 family)